ncbi:hypothetical protein L915_00613, partial [Phytophthora nicotianae]
PTTPTNSAFKHLKRLFNALELNDGSTTNVISPHEFPQWRVNATVATYNMSGRGKGAKGLGTGGSTLHLAGHSIQGISRASIRRLARRAGVVRKSGLVYQQARAARRRVGQ